MIISSHLQLEAMFMAANIRQKKHPEKASVFMSTLRLLIHNFFDHNVGRNAAGLAYYLLFALFPLLVFLSNLLGLLHLNITSITHALQQFLPKDIVGIIESYLEYVSNTSSHSLLWFA